MRAWLLLLGGLIVWAAQFFLLYAIGSIFLTTPTARVLTGAATVAAVAADVWLLSQARRAGATATDGLQRWLAYCGGMLAGLSIIAVSWQGLPALLA
jgi:hypothetical protein